jgi:hypothetical protein
VPTKARVCLNGHDKNIVGRRKDGACLACDQDAKDRYDLKQRQKEQNDPSALEVRRKRNRFKTQESVRRKRERLAGRPRPSVCEVCESPGYGQQGIVFDHDHVTGKFRGWLCNSCNVVLGYTQDDAERLLKLAMYLESHNAKRQPKAG